MKLSEFFKENGWCKGGYAKDHNGCWDSVDSPKAVSFCLAGAMLKLGYSFAEHIKVSDSFGRNITTFNDLICESKEQLINELEKRGL